MDGHLTYYITCFKKKQNYWLYFLLTPIVVTPNIEIHHQRLKRSTRLVAIMSIHLLANNQARALFQ